MSQRLAVWVHLLASRCFVNNYALTLALFNVGPCRKCHVPKPPHTIHSGPGALRWLLPPLSLPLTMSYHNSVEGTKRTVQGDPRISCTSGIDAGRTPSLLSSRSPLPSPSLSSSSSSPLLMESKTNVVHCCEAAHHVPHVGPPTLPLKRLSCAHQHLRRLLGTIRNGIRTHVILLCVRGDLCPQPRP